MSKTRELMVYHSMLLLGRGVAFAVILLLAGNPLLQAAEGADATRGNLLLIVQGMKNEKGVVRATMVVSPDDFAGTGQYFQKAAIPIHRQEARFVFTDIPFGEYAIKLYHDENNNGKLDTYPLFGIPSEAYGFSNNPRADFGRPSFSEAMFVFDKSEHEILITLQ